MLEQQRQTIHQKVNYTIYSIRKRLVILYIVPHTGRRTAPYCSTAYRLVQKRFIKVAADVLDSHVGGPIVLTKMVEKTSTI